MATDAAERVRRVAVACAAVLVGCGEERDVSAGAPEPAALVIAYGGTDRVVATERDQRDRDLELTSGSLLVRHGVAWSGPPDAGEPDPHAGTTHSAVFRARTRRAGFGDVRVGVRVRNEGLATSSQPAAGYDGISVGVRYRSPDDLYYVNVHRRDGLVVVKRKAGGRYRTLGTARREVPYGEWDDVTVDVRTVGDAVEIRVAFDGEELVRVTDDVEPILDPGRVLLRADNCQFSFQELRIAPLATVRG